MLKKAIINITLGIKGPILYKAIASSSWGIDDTFDRDYKGIPFIDRSHIKGKLREALKELGTSDDFINKWLGKGDSDGGMLIISDFYHEKCPLPVRYDSRLTRTKMDRERGVVDDTALIYMENAFPLKDTPYEWKGSIEFISEDNNIDKVYTEILTALKWITAVGSEKTIGFGKIVSVKAEILKEDLNLPVSLPAINPQEEWFTVTIEAEEPLLIGSVQRATNYLESEIIIYGGMIKGALAATLNTLCGVTNPVSTPINESNKEVSKHYPALSRHFSNICFTHAFPTTTSKRPVVIPYSAVAEGVNFYDVALDESVRLVNGKAPVFQTDWKNYPDAFGWSYPRAIAKTRTAIDEYSRKAEEGMMFTYQYVCPVDSENNKIKWLGMIRLPELPEEDRGKLHAELLDAIPRITRIGKRRSRVRVSIKPGKCENALTENDRIINDIVVVSLQSDALMVNPDEIKSEQTASKLHDLYSQYWEAISEDSIEMVRFFAHQRMLGGYLVKKHGGKYYPFYLTGAGSVFVLNATIKEKARQKIEEWKTKGLPIPEWAKKKYQKNGKELWQTCPYIPENGYGEVMINLKFHFDNRIPDGGGAK